MRDWWGSLPWYQQTLHVLSVLTALVAVALALGVL